MQHDRPKVIQIANPPSRAKFLIPPDELRYELPFAPSFPNLVYVDHLRNERWFTPLQIHDYFEICYIAEGCGSFILDGVKHDAKQGYLFVTKPHEVHGGAASGEGSFTMYSLGFHFDDLHELESDYYVLGPDRIVQDSVGTVPEWFEKLMRECESEAPYAAVMAKAYWTALLTEILRLYSNNALQSRHGGYAIPDFIKSALSTLHISASAHTAYRN